MKKLLILPLFFLVSSLCAEVFNLPRPRGLNTDDSEITMQDGQSPDALNVVTDVINGIKPRKGFVAFSTETSISKWVFPLSNGTRYLINQSSGTLKATAGITNFTVFVGTVDVNVLTVGVAFGDRFYYGNQTDGLKYWDGNSVTISSPGLKMSLMVAHKGRLWVNNVNNRREIYGSKYLDGSAFNLEVNPTEDSPTRIQVQGKLDENLSVFFASFKDKLMWFKPHSFGAITGSRRTNFGSIAYSQDIGSSYPESVQDCDGVLRWLTSDRSIYEFDGSTYKKITEDNDTLMASFVQGDLNQRVWTQTTAADWGAGSFTAGLSSVAYPGDVVFISTPSADDDFEDGDYTNNHTWTVMNGSFSIESGRLKTSSISDCGLPGSPLQCQSSIWTLSGVSYGYWLINIQFSSLLGIQNYDIMSNSIIDFEGANGYRLELSTSGTNYLFRFGITNSIGSLTVLASSMVAQGVSGHADVMVFRSTDNIFSIYRNVKHTDPLNPQKILIASVTDNTYVGSGYFNIHYNPSNPASTGFPYNELSLGEISIFGPGILSSSFTTQPINIGTNITSWGTFNVTNALNDGTMTFDIFSDTDAIINPTDATTYTSKQAITSGAIPTIATGPYASAVVYFTKTDSTQSPTLNAVTFNWNEGALLRTASVFTNRKQYWLSVAISSSANNSIFVCDRNYDFHLYSGINADNINVYNGNILFGNQGGIWQAETGNSDNGANINAYFKSKSHIFGSLNNRKTFDYIYMTTNRSDATLQTEYYLDGVNTAHDFASYQMNGESGIQDFKLPVPFNQAQQGKFLSLKWTVNSATDWALLNSAVYYDTDPEDDD